MPEFTKITRNPKVMGGKPCIRGMRMTVGMIVGQMGGGATIEELLEEFPLLEREDILEAMSYAAWVAEGRVVEAGATPTSGPSPQGGGETKPSEYSDGVSFDQHLTSIPLPLVGRG